MENDERDEWIAEYLAAMPDKTQTQAENAFEQLDSILGGILEIMPDLRAWDAAQGQAWATTRIASKDNIDVTDTANKIGFFATVMITPAVEADLRAIPDDSLGDYDGRLFDLLWMAMSFAGRVPPPSPRQVRLQMPVAPCMKITEEACASDAFTYHCVVRSENGKIVIDKFSN